MGEQMPVEETIRSKMIKARIAGGPGNMKPPLIGQCERGRQQVFFFSDCEKFGFIGKLTDDSIKKRSKYLNGYSIY